MSEKDLYNLFRENENQLNERPSNDVWRRLDSRLEEHKQRNRHSNIRMLLSAAATLILLVTIGLIVSLQTSNSQNQTAENTAPAVLEDLSNYTDTQPIKVMEFTRKHNSRLANPVEEGSREKKLMPKVQ